MKIMNILTDPKKQQSRDAEDDLLRRLVRIETRLIKLMQHFGLTADGTAVTPAQHFNTTKDKK